MSVRGSVLVVEDDDSVRELICSVLEDEGYLVRGAANGQQALAVVDQCDPVVILADVRMPVMDGCTFARTYRQRGGRSPIIALTGSEVLLEPPCQPLFTGVLSKPFNVLDLLELVAEYGARQGRSTVSVPSCENPQAARGVTSGDPASSAPTSGGLAR